MAVPPYCPGRAVTCCVWHFVSGVSRNMCILFVVRPAIRGVIWGEGRGGMYGEVVACLMILWKNRDARVV